MQDYRVPNDDLALERQYLTEPVDLDSILLHNEASDSSRINHLTFKVLEVKINADQLTPWDMKAHLELDEFKMAAD